MKYLQRGLFQPNVTGITLVAATSIGIAFAGTLLVLENESRHAREPHGQPEE